MDEGSKKSLIRTILIVVGILLLVLIIAFVTREKTISTGAQFYLSPMDAVVKLDGTELEQDRQGKTQLTPGDYTIEISREFFVSETQDITVIDGQVVEVLALLDPDPGNTLAAAMLQEPEEVANRENISYRLSLRREQKTLDDYPIISRLPRTTPWSRIDYGVSQQSPNDPTKIALYITTESAEARQEILDWMRTEGFNPEQFEIIYRSF